jgi:DNA-binding CsgD family transcriptional regulator
MNLGEPGVIHLHGDLAEIRIARGDFDDAAAAIAWLDQRGEALSRPWAIGVAARGRGLLFAARGDTNAAVSELNRSIQTLVPLGQPFEIARSFLALGVTQRRAKQKRAAREAFERATEIFTEIGAKAWAEKALAETTRVGGRRSERQELTETEATIATLVGEGLTNAEIAARLYISPRTVEANLTRVYRKMEVSSRAQLTQRLSNPGG